MSPGFTLRPMSARLRLSTSSRYGPCPRHAVSPRAAPNPTRPSTLDPRPSTPIRNPSSPSLRDRVDGEQFGQCSGPDPGQDTSCIGLRPFRLPVELDHPDNDKLF